MYSNLIEVRDIDITGERNWFWVKGDSGAFGDETDGPMRDWIDSHSKKYFEHVKNFDTIVTGGACCGMHVRFYAKMFKHVIAFEPDPLSFYCMSLNAQSDNVVKLNAAMGPNNQMVGLSRPDRTNIGMNQISTDTSKFLVPMISIDSLNLNNCDIIQLDVEGMEMDAILGSVETIKRCHPVVIGERFDSHTAQRFMKEKFGYKLVGTSFFDAIYIPE
jgi:FkbM family methyltransferase